MGRARDFDIGEIRQRLLPVMVPGDDNALAESEKLEPQDLNIDSRMAEILDEMNDKQEKERAAER